MSRVKRPLNGSIIMVCSLFVGLLCAISSVLIYFVYTTNMYKRYQKQLDSVLTYVSAHIDHDDMAECADTFVESETYKEFQTFFNGLADYYPDMHYLYLMKVVDEGQEVDGVAVFEICAANSMDEIGTDMELHLGDGEIDWFEESEIKEYREILKGRKDKYFRNETRWGIDYTLARPVCDSNGNYYGLLCADIAIDEVNTTIYKNIMINISIMIGVGVLFIVLLIMWMRKNVTKPLKKLENSVTDFANSSAGLRDPEELKYISLQIHTKNEVESLANAYEKLSINMKEYIKGIVEAEKEARGLKKHVKEINVIAYHDALTHVKNKAAFDEKCEELTNDIQEGNTNFGIVMADINSLKDINDKYGHEKGDEYIIGACKIICDIYAHSNVYRIGGDEFVVLIQGRDFDNRNALLESARREFRLSMNDESREPWDRYSAAVGMAIYTDGDDVDKIFSHADQQMYDNKKKIKETYKVL